MIDLTVALLRDRRGRMGQPDRQNRWTSVSSYGESMIKKNFDWNAINGLEKHYYSERLVLRPLLECDVYPMFMATTDSAFNRYLLWDAPRSVEQLSGRIDGILDERRKGRMGVWVAAEITTGAFVALFRAYAIDSPPEADELHVETGIWLHPNYWMGGLSVEVSSMCLDLIFGETPTEVLIAQTHVDNKPSQGLFRVMGLERVRHVEVFHENGALVPAYYYQIKRSNYKIKGFVKERYMDIEVTKQALTKKSKEDLHLLNSN
jgi:RimJ/RimL family protein N-acetyltransferase